MTSRRRPPPAARPTDQPVVFGRRAAAHEWVSFEDPDEDRTWVFDVTFLSSRWACLYGNGCQGVLTGPAPELEQGCCSYGAHFTDGADATRVHAAALRLTSEQWQHQAHAVTAKGNLKAIKKSGDGETVTKMVDGACIFLNRPGFPGGAGCALHRGALEAGERPLDWKPAVCWQLPLRREDETAADGHVTSTIRQWDRRHWGDGGAEFHWWCTEAPEAVGAASAPVYETLRDELVELTSRTAYDLAARYLAQRRALLPHPAVVDGQGSSLADRPHP